jgi:phosphoribosylamine---glycine ligase
MNILLLGSGGREHALARQLSLSPHCAQLYIAPGNAGTATVGDNVPIGVNEFEALAEFAVTHAVTMIVVGPEDPLVLGIYDYFQHDPALQHIAVIGPSRRAAMLEGSKAFAKRFMATYGIPTAGYGEFDSKGLSAGFDFIDTMSTPIVLKADGLAAGKGVLILDSHAKAKAELEQMLLHAKFGKASSTVVIEQFLKGIEFSVFVLTDGRDYLILPEAKDYKRIGEGDTGLNTGGMGAVSPVPFCDAALMKAVEDTIIRPTVQGIAQEGWDYKGFIFFGLILVGGVPMVIEYNCRLGDPETEVVIPRLQSDLVSHLASLHRGTLSQEHIDIDPRTACAVVVASGGYPGDYSKNKTITGIADTYTDTLVFHSGTKRSGRDLQTNGGRVLAVTSYGSDIHEAVARSNEIVEQIHFEGRYYRRDIGWEFMG